MENIEDQTSVSTSTPEEAATHLRNAPIFSIEPTAYKNYKDELNAKADDLQKPTEAEAPVKQFMAQSTEHTALATPDVDTMNYVSRQAHLISDYIFDRPTKDRQAIQLSNKKMNDPGSFTDDDQIALDNVNADRSTLAKRNYGLDGPIESLPAKVAGGLSGMARGFGDALNNVVTNPMHVPQHTGLAGFAAKAALGASKAIYDSMTGATYNELSNIQDAQGNPLNIDEATKKGVAQGVGVVGTALQSVIGVGLMKTTPWLNQFINPSLARTIVEDPTMAAVKSALIDITQNGAIMSGVAGVNAATSIVGEEIAKSYDGTQESFLNGITAAGARIKANPSQILQPALEGLATGVTIAGVTQAAGFSATKQRFQSMSDFVNEQRMTSARDVTPETPLQITGEAPAVRSGERDVTPPVIGGGDPVNQSVKVLQAHEAFENMAKVTQQTEMKKLAPEQLSQANKMIFDSAGMDKVWVGADDLKAFIGDDPKRAAAARNLIDSSGTAAAALNSPVAVEPHKFMDLVHDYPEASKLMRISPEGPTPLRAETYLANLHSAEQKRSEILDKLGATKFSDEELNIDLRNQDPEQAAIMLGTKEKAEAYVNKMAEESKAAQERIDAAKSEMRPVDPVDLLKLKEGNESAKIAVDLYKKLPFAADAVKQALEPVKNVGDVAGGVDFHGDNLLLTEDEYHDLPTFTGAIEKILPKGEVQKFNDAQLAARREVSAQINDKANADLVKVQNAELKSRMEAQRVAELTRLIDDPNYAIVDKFKASVKSAKGKTLGIYQVDPKSLTDAQLGRYLTNPLLKEHKFFRKDGVSVDDAAKLIGAKDGDDLLDIMANTPPREKIVAARTAATEAMHAADVLANVKLDETKLAKSFSNSTANHLLEMKFMREQQWPATKGGIKRIALPLPRAEELTIRAEQAIKGMKVSDLNVRQFQVGERVSQRAAVNAILKNEVEKAFMNKEKAALNSELQRATAIAIGETNKVFDFVKKLNRPDSIQMFKDAGPEFENAKNEILGVFKLDLSKKDSVIQGSYQKWVKKMYEAGYGDFEISPRLSDVRASANDLTVEQVKLLGDRLKTLDHLAEWQNRMFNKFSGEERIQTQEAFAMEVNSRLKDHPDYNPDRLPSIQQPEAFERIQSVLATIDTSLTAFKHIALTLDQEKPLGFFYKELIEPLTGEGEFKNKQGFSGDVHDRIALLKFLDKTIEGTIGRAEYDTLRNTWLDVPEFKDVAALNYGRLVKGDLLIMMGQQGDPDGRANIEKMGVSLSTVKAVLEREFPGQKHADFVHNFMHKGKESYWDRTIELQQKRAGGDVTMIKGVPWEHNGTMRPGGYMRQHYRVDFDAKQMDSIIENLDHKASSMTGAKDEKYFATQAAAEMTEQGRLESRVGSSQPLDLAFSQALRDYEEIIHDLNYGLAVVDVLKKLRDPSVRQDIISTVGLQKYRVLTNTVINVAGQLDAENSNYFSDQSRFSKKLLGSGKSGFAIARIGANAVSAAIQPVSVVLNTIPKMGANALKHFAITAAQIARHPFHYQGFVDFASDLETSIRSEHNEVSDAISSTFERALPSKNLVPKAKPITALAEKASTLAMSAIQVVDTTIKSWTVLSAYRQFIHGDVEGFPLEKVQAMDKTERHQMASKYAAQISETTLTRSHEALDKSYFQNDPKMTLINHFMNDARQTYAGMGAQWNKVKWAAKDTAEGYQAGGIKGAAPAGADLFKALAMLVITTSIGRAMEDWVRGNPAPFTNDHDMSTHEGQWQAMKDYGKYIITAPPDILATVIPGVRDVHYVADTKRPDPRKPDLKEVTLPVTQIMTSIATTYNYLSELMDMDLHAPRGIQQQQLMLAMGYVLQLPVNGTRKFLGWLDDHTPDMPSSNGTQGAVDRLHEMIQKYKADPPKGASNETIQKLEDLDKTLVVQGNAEVPADTYNVIKQIQSGGQWDKFNKESGAAGVYQFTEKDWNDISKRAPDLGLTENGRVSKDPSQQERAMKFQTEANAKQLLNAEIPVDAETLYGAHIFGADKATKLYQAAADAKVKTLLKPEDLQGLSEFKNFKTVGQVRKQIKAEVNDKRLTLTAGKTED